LGDGENALDDLVKSEYPGKKPVATVDQEA